MIRNNGLSQCVELWLRLSLRKLHHALLCQGWFSPGKLPKNNLLGFHHDHDAVFSEKSIKCSFNESANGGRHNKKCSASKKKIIMPDSPYVQCVVHQLCTNFKCKCGFSTPPKISHHLLPPFFTNFYFHLNSNSGTYL